MAAVYGIVRRHGGALRVLSEPGEGTSVCVLLPAAAPTKTVSTDPREGDAVDEAVGGETVLVVDDEADVRFLLRTMLEEARYDVVVASGGQEALDIIDRNERDIHAVVLDLTMPQLGGAETLAGLKERRPDLPVIICSGYGEQEVIERIGRDDATGFLKKPFRQGELLEAVRRAIGTSDCGSG